ncbi:MAG: hypothetical protein H7Y37_08885 [Anaerolineae bacterium]|nr:hypothetical protein [Gloeobacterales cyanobacterium ES-bin-313]
MTFPFTVKPAPVLSISPASQSVTQGNAASHTVSVNTNGYPDNINVSVNAQPDVSVSPSSFTLSGTQTSRVVTFTTTTGTSAGSKTINVSGSGTFNSYNSFAKVTGASGTLNVQSAAPPTITIAPASGASSTATANPGATAAYNLQLNIPNTYLASLTMAVDPSGTSPELSGATYNFNPTTVSFNASTTTLNATLSTSTPSGAYKIRVKAMPTPGSPPATIPTFDVSLNVNSINDAVFVSQSLPDYLYPSEVRSGSVTMQNTGSTTWSAAVAYRLGFPNPGAAGPFAPNNWNSGRIDVPANVTPGQNTTFNFNLTAPSTPSTFTFQSQMVQENVQWFGQFTAAKSIVVGYPDLVVTDFSINPATPTVGQPATFTVNVLNQGTNPTPAGVPIGIAFSANGAALGVAAFAATPLAPGQSSTAISNAWTPSVGGAQDVTAFVDDINLLGSTEPNKANNTLTKTVTVIGPSVRILNSTGGDITDTTQTVSVGQRIQISAQLANLPAGTTGSWTVPGTNPASPLLAVQNWEVFDSKGVNITVSNPPQINTDVAEGVLTPISSESLNKSLLTFYWVAPSNPPATQGNQIVKYTVTANNTTYTGQVTFDIRRPSAPLSTDITPPVAIGDFYNNPNGGTCVKQLFGLITGTGCDPNGGDNKLGITFTANPTPDPLFPGTFQWVQKITNSATYIQPNGYRADAMTELALDNQYPYAFYDTNTKRTNDTPTTTLDDRFSSVARADSFTMWLMFKPDQTDSTWVPISSVEWSWSGAVERNPAQPGGWIFTAGGTPSKAANSFVNNLLFPTWTQVYKNAFSLQFTPPTVAPTPITQGTTFTVNGNGLATTRSVLLSNTIPANFTIVSDTQLRITVPANLPAGPVSLKIVTATTTFTIPSIRRIEGDYNGDGRSDPAVFYSGPSGWVVLGLPNVSTAPNTIPAPADYDGDGKTDYVVFNPTTGTWSGQYATGQPFNFGPYGTGGIPVASDYNGDGKAEPAVFYSGSSGWVVLGLPNVSTAPNTIPAPGDYDGDGKTDYVVFNPTTGTWSGQYATGQPFSFGPYGTGAVPVVALSSPTLAKLSVPSVSSFTPTSGAVNSAVTITGTNFTGLTGVAFNGTPSTSYFLNSDSQITTTVPDGATSGLISVVTSRGTANSSTNFTIAAPSISGFNSTTVPVGGTLIINGSNLTGATVVKINGVSVPFTPGSSITVLIPSGITSGLVSVTTPGGTATSTTALSVPAAPLDVSVVMEDASLPVLKSFAQFYSGYPTPVSSPTGSPRNPVNRYNITPASRTTTVGCFTGASACPTGP